MFYPEIQPINEAISFHYKQEDVEITVDNTGRFHGTVSVGTNTEVVNNQLYTKKTPIILKKSLTFNDNKVFELSDKFWENEEESSEDEEIVTPEYIFGSEKNDVDIERRVFLVPPSILDGSFKYGFELYADNFNPQRHWESDKDVTKIGDNYIVMKPIPKINSFVVSKIHDINKISPKKDCKLPNVVDRLKAEWKGSLWSYRLGFLSLS